MRELVKEITPSRISIQVDHIAYVIDLKPGQEVEHVVADFMAAWRLRKEREQREVAVIHARRNRAEQIKTCVISAEAAELTEEEIADLVAPHVPATFDFPGFEAAAAVKPTPAPVKAPAAPVAVKTAPAGMQAVAAA